ncbi:hypothetical protein LGH70_10840 [Hymenobacter sp. BT635]|uniref:Uncharacterized protein n=1 Tax=Hymenobacter nitidus TaxID=2880929 RepID=A0ABS8ADV5_9BACT|nr:hypothetical protein [Hymenobacter nitidus]MCB2378081.1 hypothetical protein [Hymenobacter nitidus]
MEPDEEKWAQEYEKTLTDLFGPPQKRLRRQRGYLGNLCGKHSEPLIRNILAALAEIGDFAPARGLREAGVLTAPLTDLLRPYDYPWFRLTKIRWTGELLEVVASHGIRRAGGEQQFILRQTSVGLELQELGWTAVY